MKQGIHPKYDEAKVHCSCGETFTTKSTKDKINVEICSKCHPFFTGKQKFVDTGGRVERFRKKFAALEKQKEAEAAQAKETKTEDKTEQPKEVENKEAKEESR